MKNKKNDKDFLRDVAKRTDVKVTPESRAVWSAIESRIDGESRVIGFTSFWGQRIWTGVALALVVMMAGSWHFMRKPAPIGETVLSAEDIAILFSEAEGYLGEDSSDMESQYWSVADANDQASFR